jgi:DNA-binding NarL/FixJ family response regulator
LFVRVAQSTVPTESFAIRSLSEREREVLALIARGFSNSDIAANLHLSTGTVRNYVSIILDKLNVADRTQAAILALSSGFIDLNTMNDP